MDSANLKSIFTLISHRQAENKLQIFGLRFRFFSSVGSHVGLSVAENEAGPTCRLVSRVASSYRIMRMLVRQESECAWPETKASTV